MENIETKEKFIMKRTEILCPECMCKHLIHEKEKDLYCDECGTEFVFTDMETKTFRYKEKDYI